MEKAREFQKNTCFCFIDYAKEFDCMGRGVRDTLTGAPSGFP